MVRGSTISAAGAIEIVSIMEVGWFGRERQGLEVWGGGSAGHDGCKETKLDTRCRMIRE